MIVNTKIFEKYKNSKNWKLKTVNQNWKLKLLSFIATDYVNLKIKNLWII